MSRPARTLEHPDSRWALRHMPLTAQAVSDVAPALAGKRLAMCLHVEPKTAVLVSLLVEAGMDVALTGSPGTTNDEVALAAVVTGELPARVQSVPRDVERRIAEDLVALLSAG